jgi:hypothetical protein
MRNYLACIVISCLLSLAFCSNCSEVPASKIRCDFNCSCLFGEVQGVTCESLILCDVRKHTTKLIFKGEANFTRVFTCKYCFQVEDSKHTCDFDTNCDSTKNQFHIANCTVPDDTLCLGMSTSLLSLF